MDEHWDGGGYPDGVRHQAIPLLGRIIGIAQVADIFASEDGPARAMIASTTQSTFYSHEPLEFGRFTKLPTLSCHQSSARNSS
jgi:response regulator RpfG family c-di-GMP phosphodiesterase